MATGLKALHDIDRAIIKARTNVSEAAKLPNRASKALADVSRRQAAAYADIAKLRLDLIETGADGNTLGQVDRQAAKLLKAHEAEEGRLAKKADASLAKIAKLEADRRAQEKRVTDAINAYDKGAEACQKALAKDPDYIKLLTDVENTEATLDRARAKHELAKANVREKGKPYHDDPYFRYLQIRKYGTKNAKGWFLTRWLDGWIARRGKYRDAALNYKRLTAIPVRLARHVKDLEAREEAAKEALKKAEEKALVDQGVTALKKKSLTEQAKLDKIDAAIEAAEAAHQDLRNEQAGVSAGDSAPYRQAIELLVNTLKRKDLPSLRRLASQTTSKTDDRAINEILELARHAEDLREDQSEAKKLLAKYQRALRELEQIRAKFKRRRFDSPSSQFPSGNLIAALLGQVIAGMLDGDDVWRQIERAQRTVRRHSDMDFGGIDWTEAMRLPRNSGGWGGSGGGWGGSRRRRTPTRMPRMPRSRGPKIRIPRGGGGRSGGGFRTGGGF